ncbi:MAG: geranylgeranylglyceryl/heptaprenylglyceryl phosphate synthase [Paludibacter sp.]|nr:geranylgeranylglyceryl/heptaprenylglyceryl phosphate synthase [Bacteroidales bacterium]MCM1069418.1 geranylgeranylglyceryl/heptaprenylglyceryl phosphate synthase [Prevotella sp.]MCM1353793.1 geranylgeranylglyceryl/heptaprenylglyceryl phosphate synthase [Bacteroides sp.]MCM1442806.1 geranylgeranylglyceryl/heptaprenylglyceryl phosphate synthase [Muribaculum sp.]MCM1481828.1 geranylgeranylglyceryl/heptaprenylglyceryl phosphate synthase [Paludibacter sp.]
MNRLYEFLLERKARKKRTLAVLLDPEKTPIASLPHLCALICEGDIDLVLVGGSGWAHSTDDFVCSLKQRIAPIPVVLFPGSPAQFSSHADALLLLSLISGRNAELLIGQHVANAVRIQRSGIETIPTGYILVDGGKTCTTEIVSGTSAITQDNLSLITSTALAGEMLGMRLVYLEAGSGALTAVNEHVIRSVRENISIPLIVGGGIGSLHQMQVAFEAGADMVVIGNHFEQHPEDIVSFGKYKALN